MKSIMLSKKTNCPVPFDQQPLNEYLSLKDSVLFSWSLSPQSSFIFGFLFLFIVLFIFFSTFLVVFSNVSDLSQLFLLDLLFSNVVIFFLFIRLYLGWSYIIKRLMSATVFYEESGWYDGQVWIKTSDYLVQDRLVGVYQVIPFILRIKYSCFSILLNFLAIYLFHSVF
uniref:hypothetical protein n=1 Tax=Xiphosiphonia pinnulata TaxID=2305477 RepID=UPI0022FD7A96|nr:hypothetical protein PN189_pgp082 [Xiphosiphonia pinnulata]WAX03501.1 hypothetical protein [Xiphosiphonia pinnulata]